MASRSAAVSAASSPVPARSDSGGASFGASRSRALGGRWDSSSAARRRSTVGAGGRSTASSGQSKTLRSTRRSSSIRWSIAAYSTQLRRVDSSGSVSDTRHGPSLSSVTITARARSVPRRARSSSRRIAGARRRPTGR
ncbi:MAG: hypothetical protein IPN17_26555 [Deltaproteobacteria bacterium]|nr:hypothetical protein [Deltaproteobacteria bacterium]